MKKEIFGWGKFPKRIGKIFFFEDNNKIKKILKNYNNIIPRGNGRSYGDSSLSKNVILTLNHNKILRLDLKNKIVDCDSGVKINYLNNFLIKKNLFIPVSPGSSHVTVGGAIASDVHGKNHHKLGCFSDHIKEIKVLLGNNKIVKASNKINKDLFKATCGGMGLTGIIVSAKINLIRVNSTQITQKIKIVNNFQNLKDMFTKFKKSPYSVAWIDTLSSGNDFGKSVFIIGKHSNDNIKKFNNSSNIVLPIKLISLFFNQFFLKIFNKIYILKSQIFSNRNNLVHYFKYFYPLDKIKSWNSVYGKRGFIQYQFVTPKRCGFVPINDVLSLLSKSKHKSYLSVLKEFGEKNKNYLSFPIKGYSLALDFKYTSKIFKFLKELDKIVLKYKGRIYLTKDSRLDEKTFKAMYPQYKIFQKIRKKYHATNKFSSFQSKRIGII